MLSVFLYVDRHSSLDTHQIPRTRVRNHRNRLFLLATGHRTAVLETECAVASFKRALDKFQADIAPGAGRLIEHPQEGDGSARLKRAEELLVKPHPNGPNSLRGVIHVQRSAFDFKPAIDGIHLLPSSPEMDPYNCHRLPCRPKADGLLKDQQKLLTCGIAVKVQRRSR